MRIKIKKDAEKVFNTIRMAPTIYIFGNGGSCAIANHAEVDWTKNSHCNIRSLCSNPAMLTMIANDYRFENICQWQLEHLFTYVNEVLILISSSGNSPNIVKAAKWAKKHKLKIIGFTGFDGGELKKLSDLSVHVNSSDYEEAEDYHQSVIHEVSRLMRKQYENP